MTMTLPPTRPYSSPSLERAETMVWDYVVSVGILGVILGYLVALL